MKIQLLAKNQENPNIISFLFQPETKLDFKQGQFIRYHISNPASDDRGENRFFSIASAPFEKHLQLTTKFTPEDGSTFKKDLLQLNIDDSIDAFGPSGSFTIEDPHKNYIFIAGGIGITPFRSILMDLDQNHQLLNITLIYTNRTSELLFRRDLENLAKKHSEFKIYYLISEEEIAEQSIESNVKIIPGKINERVIRTLVPSLLTPVYYISGPEPMVMAFEDLLKQMGIPKEYIKRDYFPGYEQF